MAENLDNLNDPADLRHGQYRDDRNLNARIYLHAHFSENPEDMMRWILGHVQLPDTARVLEAGCGPGTLWAENLDRVPDDWRVTLTDLSPGMAARAQANIADPRFQYLVADACRLPLASGKPFDTVFAHFMLYHVPDCDKAIAELRRLLKPGGRLYAATVGAQHMHELYLLVNEFLDGRAEMEDVHAALPFTLENGETQLAQHFDHVELLPFPDAVVVDEVDPLVAYIQSLPTSTQTLVRGELADELHDFIAARIARDGAVRLTKRVGLFIAS